MAERLDIKKMKDIVQDIIGEEFRNNNINVNVFPLTFVEYYKGFEEREGRKFKLYDALKYVGCRGYYEVGKGNFYVCLENFDYILKLDSYFKLAKTVYHEYRHRMQEDFDEYSYEGFLRDVENCIVFNNRFDYKLNHDSYSFEIGANMYALSKAKEYMKRKYLELYEKEKSYIDSVEQRYIIDYLSYDAADTIEMFIILMKLRADRYGEFDDLGEVNPILDIFLDCNNGFRKVSEIMSNAKFKLLDQRIISAMFSCRTFLDGLDMESLSLEELEVVSNALEYTNNVYKNQVNSLDKFKFFSKEKFIEVLKTKKSFIKKIGVISQYYINSLDRWANNSKNNTDPRLSFRKLDVQIENMKFVFQKFNQSKKLIKQKNNHGFFVSDMFYIIGLLFTIFTVIYVIISKL